MNTCILARICRKPGLSATFVGGLVTDDQGKSHTILVGDFDTVP